MFCVFLKFSAHKARAPQHVAAHKEWLEQGFSDGVLLLSGSLADSQGGLLLVHNTTLESLQQRLARDPFVAQDVVTAEITPFVPHRADARLQFLVEQT